MGAAARASTAATRARNDSADAFFRAQLATAIAQESRLRFLFQEGHGCRIADIGCGHGHWLEYFESLNRTSHAVFGIDSDAQRVAVACSRVKRAHVIRGDARELPWPSSTFDLVSQFVVFTSVRSASDRRAIAGEMVRVLKPGGCILWHDSFAPNPWSHRTRPVRRSEIASLFPDCRIHYRRVTLVPPLARLSLRLSYGAAKMLDQLPFLHSHYLAIIQPVVD